MLIAGRTTQARENIDHAIKEFRRLLPNASKAARTIDRHEPPTRIAFIAVQEGYKAFALGLLKLMEAVKVDT
jgi:hypothetical protein